MSRRFKNIIVDRISDLDERMTALSAEGYEFDGIYDVGKNVVAVFSTEVESKTTDSSVKDGIIAALRHMATKDPMRFVHCVGQIRRGGIPKCQWGELSEPTENILDDSYFSVEAVEAVMRYVTGEGIDMRINDE